jgi:hypothetical protein
LQKHRINFWLGRHIFGHVHVKHWATIAGPGSFDGISSWILAPKRHNFIFSPTCPVPLENQEERGKWVGWQTCPCEADQRARHEYSTYTRRSEESAKSNKISFSSNYLDVADSEAGDEEEGMSSLTYIQGRNEEI